MLVKDISAIHGQTVGNVNLLINHNIKRFKKDIDIIDLKAGNFAIVLNKSGFSQNQINATKNIYLLSERGYSKLLKMHSAENSADYKKMFLPSNIPDGYGRSTKSVSQAKKI